MEKDSSLTAEESFKLITQIIEQKKIEVNENGFIYLFWGWLIVLASGVHLVLVLNGYTDYLVWMWGIVTSLGWTYSLFYFLRVRKKSKQSSILGNILLGLWGYIGISFLMLFIFFNQYITEHTYLILLLLFGLGILVSGLVLQFRPLVYAGILCQILSFSTFFIPFQYQISLLIVSQIVGNLIPGYWLRSKYKKS